MGRPFLGRARSLQHALLRSHPFRGFNTPGTDYNHYSTVQYCTVICIVYEYYNKNTLFSGSAARIPQPCRFFSLTAHTAHPLTPAETPRQTDGWCWLVGRPTITVGLATPRMGSGHRHPEHTKGVCGPQTTHPFLKREW